MAWHWSVERLCGESAIFHSHCAVSGEVLFSLACSADIDSSKPPSLTVASGTLQCELLHAICYSKIREVDAVVMQDN